MDLDRLLYGHTLYPYYTAFFHADITADIYNWARENRSGSINCQLGLYGPKIMQPKHLRFCPECYAEELHRFGQGYWRRMHQTPGVLVCERHHCALIETAVPYCAKGANVYAAAELETLFPAVYADTFSPAARQQAIWIAEDTQYAYNNYERIRTAFAKHQFSFRSVFLRLLQRKKLVSAGGSLRLQEYRKAFLAYFDRDLLKALGLSFDERISRPWIVSLCRGEHINAHPLYYILLARFLCGGISNLVEFAEVYSEEELIFRASSHKQVADFEEKREIYRSRWMAACTQMPGAAQSEIRKTAGSVYTWLNRHDKEWLTQHPKERKARGGNRTYNVDWAERDADYAEKIPGAAKKLRMRPGKPIQVTKTKLLREIGCGLLPAEQWNRLPLTQKAVAQEAEDRMSFHLRKMLWAEKELAASGEPIVKWRLMKLAGIRDKDWDMYWEMYEKMESMPKEGSALCLNWN
jgi:hypothetical protein